MISVKNQEPSIIPATIREIPVLVQHHLMMFEEIWDKKGAFIDPETRNLISTEYARKLKAEINTGACKAWVMRMDGTILSSGAISILSYVPNPNDPSGTIAFLHSIYTEKGYRNQGYASSITRRAIQYCRDKRIGRLYLFASADGRPLYEKEGFLPVDNMMMIFPGVKQVNIEERER